MTDDGRIDVKIANRTEKANKIYNAINKTELRNNEVKRITKLHLYNRTTTGPQNGPDSRTTKQYTSET